MGNRPDPVMFARYSYYLAFVSASIMLATFLISFVRLPIASVLVNIVWLVLVTGIVGAFMGFAANRDFKRKPGSAQAMREAGIGFRVNLGATIVTVLFAIFAIIIRILSTVPITIR